MLHCVITTIQPPTLSIHKLASALRHSTACLVVVGDRKGPASFDLSDKLGLPDDRLFFLDLQSQLASEFELAKQLPVNHYSRKNVGYLQAISVGASCIYETDDDNAPLPSWTAREEFVQCRQMQAVSDTNGSATVQWVNVYKHFTEATIWPRGLPLDWIHKPVTASQKSGRRRASIQQGLANGSPDVDAVWRLVLDRRFEFEPGASISLPPGSWCPFNSQSTWWWPQAYPLLYLPSFCSFRMTDIWRSFIAQRCLWELGHGIVFHAPEVVQERNEHDLMRDFADEVVGYLRNKEFVGVLEALALKAGKGHQGENLRLCYEALVAQGFFPGEELDLVRAWLTDVEALP